MDRRGRPQTLMCLKVAKSYRASENERLQTCHSGTYAAGMGAERAKNKRKGVGIAASCVCADGRGLNVSVIDIKFPKESCEVPSSNSQGRAEGL